MALSTKQNTALKIAALLAGVGGLAALIVSGALDDIDGDRLRAWIDGAGLWGPVVFAVALAGLQPLHISVYVFLLTAAVVWSPVEALIYSWLGIQMAGWWSFVVSRHLARDFFEARVPDKARPYLQRMGERGFLTVLAMRIVFYTTPAVQWSFGLTPVRGRDFVAASAIGTLPMTAITIFLGAFLIDWWTELGSETQLQLGVAGGILVLLGLCGAWIWKRRAKPQEE